jgi:hypothetical protein
MNWDCKTIEVYTQEHNGHTGVIWNVHWRVTKEDGDYSATTYGTQTLNTEEIDNFIPLDSVTSSDVEAWVISAMGEEAVADLETHLDAQLESEKNPVFDVITLDS